MKTTKKKVREAILEKEFKKIGYKFRYDDGYYIVKHFDENSFTGKPVQLKSLEVAENDLILKRYNKGEISDKVFNELYNFELETK